MAISYNGLWKLLIDNGMNKGELCKKTGLSSSTMAKMTNGESVKLSVLERICKELNCNFADLVDYVDDSKVKKEKNRPGGRKSGNKKYEDKSESRPDMGDSG